MSPLLALVTYVWSPHGVILLDGAHHLPCMRHALFNRFEPSSRCDPTSGGLVSAISAEQAGSPSAEVRLLEGQNFSGLQGSDQGDVG